MPHHFEHIQIRRGKCTDFISTNPILKDGEPSYVLDDNGFPVIKIGDGKTPWVDLPTFLFQTNCTPPATTLPPEPPKIDPANCNELLCVSFIDESSGAHIETPRQLVAMLKAFPGRIFVMCPVVPQCCCGNDAKNFLPAYDEYCRGLSDFPNNEGATKFVWCLYNDLGINDTVPRERNVNCNDPRVPWPTSTETLDKSIEYRDSGGVWARIKEIFVGDGALAHPDIKEAFSKLRVIAVWVDLSGSTILVDVEETKIQLITSALRDKNVTNPVNPDKGLVEVGTVYNGAENAVCPFTEPDCCQAPNSDPALISALNDLCAAYNGGAFECTTTTTTSTTTTTTTKSPEITTAPPTTTTTTTSTTTTTTTTTTSTTTTTTGAPCLGADYYINIYKSPIQWESQSACPSSFYRAGFETFYSTIVWDQDSEKYYATKYYAGGYRLVLSIACDTTKQGHDKWSAEAWTDCPNGYAEISAVVTEGTDSVPPEYEMEMDVGDCECIGQNNQSYCVYNLEGTHQFGGGFWSAQDETGEDAGTNSNYYCDKENPYLIPYVPASQDISPLTVALRDYNADQTETLVCPSGYSVYANTNGFAVEFPLSKWYGCAIWYLSS